jgi:uncharacterized repeat protein (TIGR01451 family)
VAITDVPDSIGEFIAGSVTASGAGVVVDGNAPGDSELNVAYATLGAGNTVTVSYQVRVPLPYPNGQTAPQLLSNQANADSKEQQGIVSDDPGTTDPDDPTVVDIVADPVMLISKDDQVALTAPGATIRYRIDYGNVGNQDATGVVISETVPANTLFSALGSTAGWSCPPRSGPGTRCDFTVGNLSLAPGSVIFAVQVDDPLDAGVDEIINTVDISDDGIEFDGSTPVPSTDTAMEQTPIGGALPQLTIDKDDGGIGVSPGQRYSYQIDYANIGNQGATGVVITETVPEDVVFSATGSLPTRWSCPDRSPPGSSRRGGRHDLPTRRPAATFAGHGRHGHAGAGVRLWWYRAAGEVQAADGWRCAPRAGEAGQQGAVVGAAVERTTAAGKTLGKARGIRGHAVLGGEARSRSRTHEQGQGEVTIGVRAWLVAHRTVAVGGRIDQQQQPLRPLRVSPPPDPGRTRRPWASTDLAAPEDCGKLLGIVLGKKHVVVMQGQAGDATDDTEGDRRQGPIAAGTALPRRGTASPSSPVPRAETSPLNTTGRRQRFAAAVATPDGAAVDEHAATPQSNSKLAPRPSATARCSARATARMPPSTSHTPSCSTCAISIRVAGAFSGDEPT